MSGQVSAERPSTAVGNRKQKFIQGLASGKDAKSAALAAGYSAGYAEQASVRIARQPDVRSALAEIQDVVRTETIYTLKDAIAEVDAAIAFAKKNKNAMAYVRGLEYKGKLTGFNVDRVQEVPFDLKEALEYAKSLVNWGPLPVVVNTGSEPSQLASPQESTDRMSEVYSEPQTDGESGDSASVSEPESQSQAG